MNMQIAPQLGHQVLIVTDASPTFLDTLHRTVTCLSQTTDMVFTLLCCCPTHYWGHSGEGCPELKRYIEALWEEEESEFNLAQECLDCTKSILEEIGIPTAHIQNKIATEDSLITATMAELKLGDYTGVIVSATHYDIVNRLLGRGLTDVFRKIPNVQVWAIDPKTVRQAQNLNKQEDIWTPDLR